MYLSFNSDMLLPVTPFGECGLKYVRNPPYYFAVSGHSLWGVWVEIRETPNPSESLYVTPFGECGLKLMEVYRKWIDRLVTPFGECGLKFSSCMLKHLICGHSLWGVWVEIWDKWRISLI